MDYLNMFQLLTAKPVMFAVNLNFNDFKRKKNKFLKPIYDWVVQHAPGSAIIPFCGKYESEIQDLPTEEFKKREQADDGAPSALQKMCHSAFKSVNLINFFTHGPDEVRAWIIRKGFLAPKASSVIHTDFEKGFIAADVMAFDQLKEHGSVTGMRDKGWLRTEGKQYVVQDGDCIDFKIGKLTATKK